MAGVVAEVGAVVVAAAGSAVAVVASGGSGGPLRRVYSCFSPVLCRKGFRS